MIRELDQTDWHLIAFGLEQVPPTHYLHERARAGLSGALTLGYWEKHFELLHFLGKYQPQQSVLDFGCGPGNMTLYLADAGFTVFGVDKDPDVIAIAEILMCAQVANTRNRVHYGTKIPRQEFDVCWIAHTLEHIRTEEWAGIFEELRRWCRIFEISVPIGRGYDDPTHVNHWFTAEEFQADLARAGMGNLVVTQEHLTSVYRASGVA